MMHHPKTTVLEDPKPLVEHHWSGPKEQNWHLYLLAVHPKHQWRRCGRESVQYDVDKAKEEDVCAFLIAAKGKERFYGSLGLWEWEG
jgi:GNAT superfamily N-acetyltransferase